MTMRHPSFALPVLIIALGTLATAGVTGAAFANPVPVTNTTKAPYNAARTYCNDAFFTPYKGENIACYNHDACYSDPQGRSRLECDEGYLEDMRRANLGMTGLMKFNALRIAGTVSWARCRRHDKLEAGN